MESKEAQKNVVSLAQGDVVSGVVEQIMAYGAFVRLESGQRAMIHISQLSHRYVKSVDSILQLQQTVRAQVIKIDERGRVDLSIKSLEEPVEVAPAPHVRVARGAPVVQEESSNVLEPSFAGVAMSSADGTGEDFEKKLSSFMKLSEEKISTLMSAKGLKTGRPPRRKGARP